MIFGGRLWAARGVLIAYGAQTDELCRVAASYVDKILKAARGPRAMDADVIDALRS